jgi:hypothetical protein
VRFRSREFVAFAILLALAAWVRLANLGVLGLQVDEGVQALAVGGWLDTGLPILPSGEVYQRSIPFTWLQAWSARFLGLGELALRLPAALFGVAAVAMTLALGRGLFDRRVGWAAAVFIALSAWEIELSRYGRSYTAFQVFYGLGFLCLYKAFNTGGRRARWRWGYAAAAFAAIALHEFAIILVTGFLIPLFDRQSSARTRSVALGAGATHVVVSLAYRQVVGRWLVAMAPPSGLEPVHAPAADPGGRLVLLPAVQLPDLGLLTGAAAALDPGFLLIVSIAAVAGWVAARMNGASGWARMVVLLLVLASGVAHQFLVAFLLLLAWLAWFASDLRQITSRGFWPVHLSLASSLTYWTVVFLRQHSPDWKSVVLALFGFPNVVQYFVYWFALGWPLFLLAVSVAALVLFQRYLRHGDRPALYVVAGLVLSIAAAGVFASYEESRYVFHLYPLLAVLLAWGLLRFADMLLTRLSTTPERMAIAIVVVAVGFLATRDVGGLTLAPATRSYEGRRDPIRSIISWKAYAGFHQDQAGAGAFVRDRSVPGDLVAGIGAPHQLNVYRFYAGRMDIMIGRPQDTGYQRRRDGVLVDRYTGAEVVFDMEELVRRLEGRGGWLLADDVILSEDVDYLASGVKDAARERINDIVFRGRDGTTFVAKVP